MTSKDLFLSERMFEAVASPMVRGRLVHYASMLRVFGENYAAYVKELREEKKISDGLWDANILYVYDRLKRVDFDALFGEIDANFRNELSRVYIGQLFNNRRDLAGISHVLLYIPMMDWREILAYNRNERYRKMLLLVQKELNCGNIEFISRVSGRYLYSYQDFLYTLAEMRIRGVTDGRYSFNVYEYIDYSIKRRLYIKLTGERIKLSHKDREKNTELINQKLREQHKELLKEIRKAYKEGRKELALYAYEWLYAPYIK